MLSILNSCTGLGYLKYWRAGILYKSIHQELDTTEKPYKEEIVDLKLPITALLF